MNKRTLLRLHMLLILLVLLDLGSKFVFSFGLHTYLTIALKVLIWLSGACLFFLYFRPFKWLSVYFSVYTLSLILSGLAILARGIFAALFLSLILAPISPSSIRFQQGNISVYNKFQGFMAACCSHVIKERRGLIFEKSYGDFNYHTVLQASTSQFFHTGDTLFLTFPHENWDNELDSLIVKDTTIVIGE